ncbi:MAG: hypothetical protein ABSF45_26685 [Terriglobia bacterium]|jgi:hypothetical protein
MHKEEHLSQGKKRAWMGWATLVMVLMLSATANLKAQAGTGSTQLTISMDVTPSISLVFQNNSNVGNTGFCPLSNAGTNNVGLDLGSASITGDTLSCVNYALNWGGWNYQVSSAFEVVVSKANSPSPNYRLSAEISTAPPANVTWLLSNVTLNNTTFMALDTADTYGQSVTKTLQVRVGLYAPAQTLQETITFLATAN